MQRTLEVVLLGVLVLPHVQLATLPQPTSHSTEAQHGTDESNATSCDLEMRLGLLSKNRNLSLYILNSYMDLNYKFVLEGKRLLMAVQEDPSLLEYRTAYMMEKLQLLSKFTENIRRAEQTYALNASSEAASVRNQMGKFYLFVCMETLLDRFQKPLKTGGRHEDELMKAALERYGLREWQLNLTASFDGLSAGVLQPVERFFASLTDEERSCETEISYFYDAFRSSEKMEQKRQSLATLGYFEESFFKFLLQVDDLYASQSEIVFKLINV